MLIIISIARQGECTRPVKIIELNGDVTIDDVTAGVIVDIMAVE